jgi:sec-independent protein translocase protein TatB
MFDLAWSEIALIGVVALVVIGPKDLPEAVRGLARGVQKLRRMAGEFQQHADDLVKEANLDEVRQQINEIRNFNIRNEFEKTVDRDGTLRKTFTEDPLRTDYSAPYSEPPASAMEGAAAPAGSAEMMGPPAPAATAPAFIPPAEAHAPSPSPMPSGPVPSTEAVPAGAPAFVPPAEPPPDLPPAASATPALKA